MRQPPAWALEWAKNWFEVSSKHLSGSGPFRGRIAKYGVRGREEQMAWFLAASAGCEICRSANPEGLLCIDHNHETGAFRGLLCHRCNRAVGAFDDSPEVLQAALAYLQQGNS